MTDVFVSYKAEDRRRVEPLVTRLESDGLSVWWDAQIGGGQRWRETILQNLETARCVLVVWSRRSVRPEGEFVQDEAARAKRRNTYLPLRIDKVDPPLGFGETQVLSLQGWRGEPNDPRYQAVLSAILSRLDRAAGPADGIQSIRANRRGVLLGGAIAAGGLVASGA